MISQSVFEKKVLKTISEYKLFSKKDRILVACSGGKDSTAVLYILKKYGFPVEALVINTGMGKYTDDIVATVEQICKKLDVKLHVAKLQDEIGCTICFLRSAVQSRQKVNNCYVCGIVRRWILNKKAKQLKADVIVTGHNLDDEAETILMNMMKGSPELVARMGPKTGVERVGFVQRVKPLFFLSNAEVRAYAETLGLPVDFRKCPCINSIRVGVRDLICLLEKEDSDIRMHLVSRFLKIKPRLARLNPVELSSCTNCGEPSNKQLCKACELIALATN